MRMLLVLLATALGWSVGSVAQPQVCLSESQIPSSTPTSDFVDHGDGTVTHTLTGLMWAKCTAGFSGAQCSQGPGFFLDWQGALDHAAASNHAGYNDWRLPNVTELQSIIEERCELLSINMDVFPGFRIEYWTSTPAIQDVERSRMVTFRFGHANFSARDRERRVRLVRGPQ